MAKNVAKKTTVINIRTSPQIKELINSLCQKIGLSQSNLVEYLVRKEIDHQHELEKKKTE